MIRAHEELREPISDINVTPFVDVLLVLLIIFMITAPLFTKTIEVQLPQENLRSADVSDARQFIISINSKGKYYVHGKRYPLKNLLVLSEKWQRKNKNQPVYVKADKRVSYGNVTRLMAILKNAGIQQLGLLVENKK